MIVGDGTSRGIINQPTRAMATKISASSNPLSASQAFLERINADLNTVANRGIPESIIHATALTVDLDPNTSLLIKHTLSVIKNLTNLIENGPLGLADALWEINSILVDSLSSSLGGFGKIWKKITHTVVCVDKILKTIIPTDWRLAKVALATLIARPFMKHHGSDSCPIGRSGLQRNSIPVGLPKVSRANLTQKLNMQPAEDQLYDSTELFSDLLYTFRPHVFSYPDDLVPVSLENILLGAKFVQPSNPEASRPIVSVMEFADLVDRLGEISTDDEYNARDDVPYVDLCNAKKETGNQSGVVYARALVCPRDYAHDKAVVLEYTFIRPVSYWFNPYEHGEFLFEHEGDNERCAIIVRADPKNSENWLVSAVAFDMHGIGGSSGLKSCGDTFDFPKKNGSVKYEINPSSTIPFSLGGPHDPDVRPQVFIARGSHAICAESGYRNLSAFLDLYPEPTQENELHYSIITADTPGVRCVLYCGRNKYSLGNYNKDGIVLKIFNSNGCPAPKDYYKTIEEATTCSKNNIH